ncbi:glycoside hydrolase family 2 protein [Kineococcus indalonis]|uniref:glycoside hydrolase family 2 protein n=1 Tax=Kineococcus indalonis TaxID=2696566 RepID=UPI0014121817|nr:glycoside hydrolase family 2 protein [Kineococcus indalonis]NAZ85465.1 glycoside hydrolase family 2 protein [Kineococcus indalonis]
MIVQNLHSGWTLHPAGGELPEAVRRAAEAGPLRATVPGTVHTDLLDAGLVPDPYAGLGEQELAWLHRTSWDYRLRFEAQPPAPGERADLEFAGLDTVAAIELNGTELGRTANMHRRHRFDVTAALRAGANDLQVRFTSALEHAESVEKDIGARPRAYEHPFNAVRKMACSFGWDWGPDLQTAGVWRPVELRRWRTARLTSVRPLATLEGGTGRLRVHVDLERSGLEEAGELQVHVRLGDLPGRADLTAAATAAPGTERVEVRLDVEGAPAWWPRGYGEQPLVSVEVQLRAGGEVLDTSRHRTAFRSVRLDTTPDEHGTPAVLLVNEVPVFVRGVNWIPEDHLLTRLDRTRYAAAIAHAVDANVNLLRVWGGGIYESDDFYDLCDEQGLLVWQDFLLACAAYAEEEPLASEVEAEARDNVARLCAHPSLVVWNGGNENLWGHEDWGWKEELGGSTWGLRYYEEVFPAVLAELDPTRAYCAGSPCSPGAPGTHPNDPDHGTHHVWDVWNSKDWTAYRERVPRFCSEFGWQAPPARATLEELLGPDQRSTTSPVFLAHQKAADGNGKLERGMAPHTGVPAGFEDWTWAAQLNQARAVTFAIEHFRSWWPRTAGSVYWQLNDCWPVTSWSVVDGAGRRKPAFHALRHAYAPRLLTVQPREGRAHLVLVNDTGQEWRAHAVARRTALTGEVLHREPLDVVVAARSVAAVELPAALTAPADAGAEVLVVDAGDLRTVHAFAEDRDLAWDPDPLRTSVTAVPGGYAVRVRAEAPARDVTLLADAVAPDAVVDDGLVTLLAGESRTFHVRTSAVVDVEELTRPAVLRTANAFGRPL